MTLQDRAEQEVATLISKRDRRMLEITAYVIFLLLIVIPLAAGLINDALTDRVVKLAGLIGAGEAAVGVFIGWLKTLGHRENMQQMKG